MASPSITAGVIPAWPTVKHLTLYHGCLHSSTAGIRAGVDLRYGADAVDFGKGFYTSTNLSQVSEWAARVHLRRYRRRDYPNGNSADPPAVVKFVVPLAELADLNALVFVRGDASNASFWGFVHHKPGRKLARPPASGSARGSV